MRLARILVGTWLVLGGITACSDHNPTVVFVGDAGVDGRGETGTPLDGGGSSHDSGAAAEVAAEVGGPVVDVRPADAQAPDANPAIDVAIPPDVAADRVLDLNLSIDSPPAVDTNGAIDGASSVLDGVAATSLDVGFDSSPAFDGGGTGG